MRWGISARNLSPFEESQEKWALCGCWNKDKPKGLGVGSDVFRVGWCFLFVFFGWVWSLFRLLAWMKEAKKEPGLRSFLYLEALSSCSNTCRRGLAWPASAWKVNYGLSQTTQHDLKRGPPNLVSRNEELHKKALQTQHPCAGSLQNKMGYLRKALPSAFCQRPRPGLLSELCELLLGRLPSPKWVKPTGGIGRFLEKWALATLPSYVFFWSSLKGWSWVFTRVPCWGFDRSHMAFMG